MDLYQAIKGRRSIRKFKPDFVPKEVLDRIFEMAPWAPSGMNLQNWYFVVVYERFCILTNGHYWVILYCYEI